MPSTDPRTARCLQDADNHGLLDALASPLLEKLREAIVHLDHNSWESVPGKIHVLTGPVPTVPEGKGWILSAYRGKLKWDAESRTLMVCFKFHDRPADPHAVATNCLESYLKGDLVAPSWLSETAPGAKVHARTAEALAELRVDDQELEEAIESLTGGVHPRRINCVGWCTGGMLATLGALWAAVQYPGADVRCITFGAQKVGNAAFVEAFRWLVGLSYRLVYFRDPVPSNKGKRKMMGGEELVHVHGEMFVDDTICRPDNMGNEADVDFTDHSWKVYQGALHRRFAAELQRGKAFSVSYEQAANGQPTATLVPDADAEPSCESHPDKPAAERTAPDTSGTSQPAEPSVPESTPAQESRASAVGEHEGQQAASAAQEAQPQHEALQGREAAGQMAQESTGGGSDAKPPISPFSSSNGGLQAAQSTVGRDVLGEGTDDPDADRARRLRSTVSALAKTANPSSRLGQMLMAGKVRQAALFAAAAYRDQATFQRITGVKKSKLVVDTAERNTHVHIGWMEDGTAVFAFRGTATMQDGLADVKVMRLDVHYLRELFPGARAHLGFLQQFIGVCKPDRPHADLASVLLQLSGGQAPTRVICTGHSLGGALATLGAAWAALQWCQADVRCITFGSPRVGNKPFKKAFHSLVGTSLRLVHGRDPVPVLPPGVVYHHVQGAIHVGADGRIKLRSRPWHYKLMPSLQHHGMAKYHLSMVPGIGMGAQEAIGAVTDPFLEAGDEEEEGLKLTQMQGMADNSCGSRLIFGCISVSEGRARTPGPKQDSLQARDE